MEHVGRSNLLQSWAYGEAKAAHGHWRVRRGIFYSGDEPIALVQVLQKRVAGLLRIARINRGPLFLRPLLPQEERAVWGELARFGNLRRGRVLSVAPELSLSGPSLVLLEDLGFRQFSPRAWESVWVDLGPGLDALRGQLDGKWRNMLTFSERAALKLDIRSDDQPFDWMIARYRELMQEKDFRGPSTELLLLLRKSLGEEDPLLVLRAVHETEPVAGICLARHGAAATYLLGWNGPKGRSLRANQYLLWQALMHLKQCGVRWLDLGGIDEENTPGIAAFKLGLNGERYELVGEYWKW
jgi:lipid II:glycine glycyltransferase (peptidoglycan interpeptide bridge formation enzyme)